MPHWLQDLNEQQQEAVVYGDGPLLVIAGAGSGKTRVLTYRIAHAIDARGVPPSSILAVTFTNKAAGEMRSRVSDLVGPLGDHVWVGTFHATCAQILRRHAELLGWKRNFLIFDASDQLAAAKQAVKDLNLDPKRFDPRGLLAAIGAAKNELIGPVEFARRASGLWEQTVARVYARYQELLQANSAFDFDDLILFTVRLFTEQPDVLLAYQQRFRHVLVDEYQDTNAAQYVLVNLLARRERNLTVVGDVDQSIYGWRGADYRNILNFERDYPEARVVKLERNYRSTRRILEAANHVIAHNVERPEKNLWTANPQGDPVGFYLAADERAEAGWVADEITRLVREADRAYQDVTLLYRTHAQSRTFEEEFVRRGIPYRIVSGVRFYERKEIKDLLAYLRLIHNPADGFSLQRVINVPRRGIGDTTAARLGELAQVEGISLFEALIHPRAPQYLGAAAARRTAEFAHLLGGLLAAARGGSVTETADAVLRQTGYLAELEQERTVEAEARIENLREFLSVTRQFDMETGGDLAAFLEHVALVADVDTYDPHANALTLMTLHAAKGLEFSVVFMVGMEDGVFPNSRALFEPSQLEEERRLCYVGMTRARERLYLTCARQRMLYGLPHANPVSRFVEEIPPAVRADLAQAEREALRETIGLRPAAAGDGRRTARGGTAQDGQRTARAEAAAAGPALRPGDRVRHRIFGEGTVVSVEQSGPDQIVAIAFAGQGIKKLMAAVAPLEPV